MLILHLGPASILPLPAGLLYVPSFSSSSPVPSTSLLRALEVATLVAAASGPGVMVASTDILLTGALAAPAALAGDMVLLTVPCRSPQYAARSLTDF